MGFLSKLARKDMKKQVAQMPRGGSFGFGLGEAIRRLNQQQGMMPQPISDRMPDQETLDKFRQVASRPNPFVRRIPIGDMRMPDQETLDKFRQVASRPNPFVRRIPIGDMRFRDPRFEDRRRGLGGLFGIGRKPMKPRRKGVIGKGISGLLSRLKEKMPMIETMQEEMMMPMRGGMMDVNMKEMRFPRIMMAEGDEASITNFLNADPEQIAFGIEAQINNLMGEYEMAVRNGEMERAEMLNDKINELDKMKIDIANASGKTISDMDRQMIKGYAGGGEASFPDLTGDNKITQADILKGRGVFAEGDEVSMMMMEMEGDEDGMQEEAIKELEAARPEFEMMQQLAQVVINLIEQGASEAEIVAILKEQGLDDEDIQTLLEFVNEMMGQAEQGGMAEDDIGSQLAALG